MGESKRRQQNDKTWGKKVNHQLTIQNDEYLNMRLNRFNTTNVHVDLADMNSQEYYDIKNKLAEIGFNINSDEIEEIDYIQIFEYKNDNTILRLNYKLGLSTFEINSKFGISNDLLKNIEGNKYFVINHYAKRLQGLFRDKQIFLKTIHDEMIKIVLNTSTKDMNFIRFN